MEQSSMSVSKRHLPTSTKLEIGMIQMPTLSPPVFEARNLGACHQSSPALRSLRAEDTTNTQAGEWRTEDTGMFKMGNHSNQLHAPKVLIKNHAIIYYGLNTLY